MSWFGHLETYSTGSTGLTSSDVVLRETPSIQVLHFANGSFPSQVQVDFSASGPEMSTEFAIGQYPGKRLRELLQIMLHHQASLIGEKRRDPALFGHTPLACRLPPPPQPCFRNSRFARGARKHPRPGTPPTCPGQTPAQATELLS